MNHNLQVDGYFPNLSAKCSCGKWSMDREEWEWKDGLRVREDSWEDFAAHVRCHDPDVVECYQLIGWYSNIQPKSRNYTNLSDGAVFSSRELATIYAKSKGMEVLRVNPLLLDPADPSIDYFVESPAC